MLVKFTRPERILFAFMRSVAILENENGDGGRDRLAFVARGAQRTTLTAAAVSVRDATGTHRNGKIRRNSTPFFALI